MTILVNIDGVVFNTQEHLLELLNDFNHINFTVENIDSYDLTKILQDHLI